MFAGHAARWQRGLIRRDSGSIQIVKERKDRGGPARNHRRSGFGLSERVENSANVGRRGASMDFGGTEPAGGGRHGSTSRPPESVGVLESDLWSRSDRLTTMSTACKLLSWGRVWSSVTICAVALGRTGRASADCLGCVPCLAIRSRSLVSEGVRGRSKASDVPKRRCVGPSKAGYGRWVRTTLSLGVAVGFGLALSHVARTSATPRRSRS